MLFAKIKYKDCKELKLAILNETFALSNDPETTNFVIVDPKDYSGNFAGICCERQIMEILKNFNVDQVLMDKIDDQFQFVWILAHESKIKSSFKGIDCRVKNYSRVIVPLSLFNALKPFKYRATCSESWNSNYRPF